MAQRGKINQKTKKSLKICNIKFNIKLKCWFTVSVPSK